MFLSRIFDAGLKVLDQEKLVLESGLFDPEWYAKKHKLEGGPERALAHLMKSKGKYDPSPSFSCSAYLSDNPDVKEAGLNPLLHYLRFGRKEGRIIRDLYGRVSGTTECFGDEALARLRHLFDEQFYFETNPDVDEHSDGFDHFMSTGWRQRRDPTPWFSVEAYIMDHDDLAGKNPFAHFILSGLNEGKTIRNSRRRKVNRGKPNVSGRTTAAVVAMVKNEADIIALFTSHLLALFDDIVIVDHQSEDGTRELLVELAQQFSCVQVLTLREPSYIQSVAMTHVMRDNPRLREADWIFFLDADEFLPFPTRESFHIALTRHQSCPILSIHWQNVIPAQYWSGVVDVAGSKEFFIPPSPSPFRKIAFQPRRLNVDHVVVAQGNHALTATLNGLEMEAFNADFCLIHIPIRSSDQLSLKINQGTQSYQKIGRTRDAAQGTHWQRMKEEIADQIIPDDSLNAMAVGYSEDSQTVDPITHADLSDMGFTRSPLQLALIETGVHVKKQRGLREMLKRLSAKNCNASDMISEVAATQLETCGNGDLVRLKDNAAEYAPLPFLNESPVDLMSALADFLPASHREIGDYVPSEWSGHVPFMFALASLTKPRRYVDLGTMHGTSLVAFAQTVKDSNFESEAVAVPTRLLGARVENASQIAFEALQFVASKYREMIGISPTDFVQSAYRFADGSVDLLNIDCFNDAENLEHVLDIWHPKLSARGMVILHNINLGVQPSSSIVQRVWAHLKNQYPSLEFKHGQGLGLVCCGEDVCPALLAIVNAAAAQKGLLAILQDHFFQQGRRSAELLSRRYDMNQMVLRVGNNAALMDEAMWTR